MRRTKKDDADDQGQGKGKPHSDFSIKYQKYSVCQLKAIHIIVNRRLNRNHIEALNKALNQYFISRHLIGMLRPEIRQILKANKKTVHDFCIFLKKLHDYKTRKDENERIPSLAFSDDYLIDTFQLKTHLDILLDETCKGGQRSEEARNDFILAMADLYEQITKKKASRPYYYRGVHRGEFLNFCTATYRRIDQSQPQHERIQPSTFAEAIKTALKFRAKASPK